MVRVIPVNDRDDPRLVEVSGLNDAQARALTEAEHGCFVVEGLIVLEAVVLDSPYRLRSVLVSESKLRRVLDVLGDTDVDVYVGTPALLESVTGFPIHRGIIASAARIPLPSVSEIVGNARRVVVVEGLNDHENMGAMFRNAAAFGVEGILLDPTAADPLYRRSVRVSMGHLLHVPWTRTEPLPHGLAPLREAGFTTVALTPGGDASITDLAPTDRLAWIVGAEGPGLDEATMAAADVRARIPIAPNVDSLNVATAAAIAFSHDPG
ncbi:TrmH family RNA methyltransferase [Actinospongicola halichondriae]|uniref:TrmH family RNA methyltransferase n=1 Tax=Actinospongicola halichondriae TaxID=3236844 RepID=UPI003D4DD0CB